MFANTLQRTHYTIPRKIRELQLDLVSRAFLLHYTIPRKIRELQLGSGCIIMLLIIPYQEKLGNYNGG